MDFEKSAAAGGGGGVCRETLRRFAKGVKFVDSVAIALGAGELTTRSGNGERRDRDGEGDRDMDEEFLAAGERGRFLVGDGEPGGCGGRRFLDPAA